MVTSIPRSGRVRFTYPGDLDSMNVNGISPTASAIQIMTFMGAVEGLQTADVREAYFIQESNLDVSP